MRTKGAQNRATKDVRQRAWDTAKERQFFEGLGDHCKIAGGRRTGLTRQELQQRYLSTMGLRREWGDVDPRGVVPREALLDHAAGTLRGFLDNERGLK